MTRAEPRAEVDAFRGFPSSALATPLPNLFFSRVLPEIDDVEELVVTLYFFFAQGLKRRHPRCLALRELRADATLQRALARLSSDHTALERGLALAVQRGTLLRASALTDGRQDLLYAVNTPANRRALEALTAEGVRIQDVLPPAKADAAPDVFTLYEENIGGITPLIAEELRDAEERYPAQWLREAMRRAVELNKRNWRYVSGILRRWEAEGPDYEEAGRDTESEWLARRYREGKRRRKPYSQSA